jgi:putative addiction module component (TIGR02574 family)
VSEFQHSNGLLWMLVKPYAGRTMIAENIPQLNSLSSDEKILLAAELWRQAAGEKGEAPNPELVAALRERLAYYREHPTEVSTWEEVRARILGQDPSPNA